MPRYKRTRDEAELDVPTEPHIAPEHEETLTRLRNMWEFASLMQYIFLFGSVVKIDESFDIEDLEAECLLPAPSERLASIGLALLKYVSSHRGLTPDIFDEYTRRQYEAKAPLRNPFGNDEEPLKFNELDIFTRIRVLQQLSTWTFFNADRIRGLMPQDEEHLDWRMEPLGWDKDDRSYFVLDDNRLYRRSDEPLPPPPPKPKSKSKNKTPKKKPSRGTRSSKRRKLDDTEDEEPDEVDVDMAEDTLIANGNENQEGEEPGYGFTSKTWECVAITLEDYQSFMASIFRSRDPNEKQLRARIEAEVLPIIEKRAEAIRQKQLKKMRDLENLQKMATAKRSSRLADKADKEKIEREEREAEEKRQNEIKMAHEEQERQRRIEEGHESRRLTREQRLKEREAKRILHEEELAKLEEDAQRAGSQDLSGDGAEAKRISERQLKTQREQHQKELERLAAEDEGKWIFDCSVCGMHGENLDDGTHSIACDKCSVWQHSKCHGFSPKQAEKEGFTFVCNTCKRKDEDARKPKIPTLKLGKSRPSESPESSRMQSRPPTANGQSSEGLPAHVAQQLDQMPVSGSLRPSPGPFGQLTGHTPTILSNGPSLSPQGQTNGPPGYRYPPVGNFAPNAPQQPWQGTTLPPPTKRPSSGHSSSPPPAQNGYGSQHHHQQHQSEHQNAVATAGAHPVYHAPYQSQPYTSPQASRVIYPVLQAPQQHTPQHVGHNHHQSPQYPQQISPAPPPLMKGFQSPVKQFHPRPGSSSSSPANKGAPPHGTPQQYHPGIQQQRSPQLQQSPQTNLPPPPQLAQQSQSGHSPIKSSPQQAPPAAAYQELPPPLNAPRLVPTSPQQQLKPQPPTPVVPQTNGSHQY